MSIAKNRKLYVDAYDLSGHLQGIAFDATVETDDDTVFGNTARSSEPGLDDFSLEHEGVWSAGAGAPDAVFDEQKGLADVLATIGPVDGAEGSLAYFMRTTQGVYAPAGSVGELLRFSVSLSASGGIGAVRGTIVSNATLSASGDGTAFELGAATASQKLYAGMHILSTTLSPTLDMIVESDSQEDFLGTPTTHVTFAQATAAGSQWATPVSGSIADTWWRASWTFGGTGSIDAVVVVGIQ